MNNRAYPRQSLFLTAQYKIGDGPLVSCVIRDFCSGGVYLTYVSDPDARLMSPAQIRRGVCVELLMMISGRFIKMQAKLAHQTAGALGLEFSEPDPVALAALQSIAESTQANSEEKKSDEPAQLSSYRGGVEDSRKTPSKLDVVKLKKVVKRLCIATDDFIMPLFDMVFAEIEYSLVAAANKLDRREQQNIYYHCIPTIEREKEAIQVEFQESFEQHNANIILLSQRNELHPHLIKAPQLSIVEKEEFEDWLTLKVMVTKAESAYREPLLELQLRLDDLTKTKIGQTNNPFGPSVLCDCFRGAIEPLQLHKKVTKLIYSGFKEKVLSQLDPLYRELNSTLAEEGVLPKLDLSQYQQAEKPEVKKQRAKKEVVNKREDKHKERRKKSSTAAVGQSVTNQSSQSTNQGNGKTLSNRTDRKGADLDRSQPVQLSTQFVQQSSTTPKAYGAAHELLQIKKYRESAISNQVEGEQIPSFRRYVNSPKTMRPAYSPKEIIDALNKMQSTYGKQASAEAIQEAKERGKWVDGHALLSKLETVLAEKKPSEKEIGSEEAEAVEVLERLFESIVSNPILSDEIKPLFSRLLVPAVKVLILDASLLTYPNHPVRQVLNYVARLGLKNGACFDESILYAEWAVSEIAENFETKLVVFEGVIEKLEEMLSKQEQVYQRNVSRVTEACEGQDRIEKARIRIDAEISQRLDSKQVPTLLLKLLDAGWRELLLLSYLRQGDKSKPWVMGLQIVEQLFLQLTNQSVDKPYGADSAPAIIPEALLKLINNGLLKVADTESLHAEVLAELKENLLGGRIKPQLVDFKPLVSATPRSIIEKLKRKGRMESEVASEADFQKWSDRALSLEMGEWVAFKFPGKGIERARLAWISKSRDKFVFVNHQGLKVIEQTLDEFAVNLSREAAWSIAHKDLPIVDQGLDSMVQKIYDQLAYETTHDQLTGLVSRKEFERILGRAIVRAKRDGIIHCLIYMDLDQFKVINSTCGYEAGDSLLRQIGELLTGLFADEASEGCVARLGGNTFAILVENCKEEKGYRIADNMITAIQSFRFKWKGTPFTLGVSMGLMEITNECDLVSNLFKHSESACVAAKSAGRDRVHIYKPDDEELVSRQNVMEWVAKVHRALDENRLRLRAQRIEPIVPLGETESTLRLHYEVLLCVEDEDGNQIPPVEFINAAEKYNRMQIVDRWVINTVFRWMQKNPAKLESFGGFSINLSGDSLNDERLMKFIFEEFRNFEIPRNKICFEVTETVAITNIADAADFIEEMKNIGCEFSLDDFGSGMSSYTYLKNLPVDYIKIDGAFVKGIATDANDFSMVKSITEMGHLMGKKVVAEFVENEAILEKLREIGVDYAQGYGIEKPRWIFDE